jgi:hypothetical protein
MFWAAIGESRLDLARREINKLTGYFMRWLGIVGVAIVIGVSVGAWIVLSGVPKPRANLFAGASERPNTSREQTRFTGTASCSGRACHGSLEGNTDRSQIQGNEHTTWQIHDSHAKAFSVLSEDRSKKMAKLVDGQEAVQDKRCLACHVDQEIGNSNSDVSGLEYSHGVGCETCHGAAGKWLGPHTARGELSADEKKKRYAVLGMRDLSGPRERAELCVRCHVGTEKHQVDHDLIAAGHPRLEFDLPAFLANMPPHWRVDKQKQTTEAETWAVGQLVTARRTLDLLAHRVQEQTWPEFAEYDCFACHHDMQDAAWRRKPGHFENRTPGSMRWNDRSVIFLPELLGADAEKSLGELKRALAQPMPDGQQVRELSGRLRNPVDERDTSSDYRRVLQSISDKPERFAESWDAAAQAYLAVDALSRSLGHREPSPSLKKLGEKLEFPPGTDSPAKFRAPADSDKLEDVIRKAAQAALGDYKP